MDLFRSPWLQPVARQWPPATLPFHTEHTVGSGMSLWLVQTAALAMLSPHFLCDYSLAEHAKLRNAWTWDKYCLAINKTSVCYQKKILKAVLLLQITDNTRKKKGNVLSFSQDLPSLSSQNQETTGEYVFSDVMLWARKELLSKWLTSFSPIICHITERMAGSVIPSILCGWTPINVIVEWTLLSA